MLMRFCFFWIIASLPFTLFCADGEVSAAQALKCYPPSRTIAQALVRSFPDSKGVYFNRFNSRFLLYGFANLIYDHQGGCKQDHKFFSTNELLFLTHTPFYCGDLSLHAVFSFEPGTVGRCGYPLLFATGQSANGITFMVDRYPPRNFLTELALEYTKKSDDSYGFFYFGMPGNPALGPLFDQRIPAFYLTAGSITDRWVNSTDTSFGTITGGGRWKMFMAEGSVFNGREPSENRWGFDRPHLDSVSARLTCFPTDSFIAQISYGRLKNHEQLQPGVITKRLTASLSYTYSDCAYYSQTTFTYARNKRRPGNTLNAFLLESCLNICDQHWIYARFERAETDELCIGNEITFIEEGIGRDDIFAVNKLTGGYTYQIPVWRPMPLQWSVGCALNVSIIPKTVERAYGSHPFSYFLFLRLELV